MGIRGLKTFVERQNLLENYHLHDTKVIIDGGNFLYWFYMQSKIDFQHGGDYDRVFDAVINYFEMFKTCNIEPIVLFDGGNKDYEWRIRKARRSAEDRLDSCKKIIKGTHDENFLMPILTWEVFQNALDRKQIKYARSPYDVDSHAAAMANHFKCPIISNDTDFCIFDIAFGFILLDSISQQTGQEKYLNCKIFYRSRLFSLFPGLDPKVLPLFATLLGNDVVSEDAFKTFFSRYVLANPKYKNRDTKIIQLLQWLRGKSQQETVEEVLKSFASEDRILMNDVITMSVREYMDDDTILANFLKHNVPEMKLLPRDFELRMTSGKSLPEWFVKRLFTSKVDSIFLNIMNLKKVFLPIQVENVDKDSSFDCCLRLRRIIYAICFLFKNEKGSIAEYDRHKENLEISCIKPKYYIRSYGFVPSLSDIATMNQEQREELFFAVLSISRTSFLKDFPQNWRQFSAAMVYWMKSAPPTEEMLDAVLVCALLLSVVKEKVNKNSVAEKKQKLAECPIIQKLIDKVSFREASRTWKIFRQYFNTPNECNGCPGKYVCFVDIAYSFSQLQACLLFSGYVSQILDVYLDFGMFRILNGTFLCNFIRKLMGAKGASARSLGFDEGLLQVHEKIKFLYKEAALSGPHGTKNLGFFE